MDFTVDSVIYFKFADNIYFKILFLYKIPTELRSKWLRMVNKFIS